MRPCTVCRHEAREEIDHELLDGTPFRNLAERFHLSVGALHRHRQHHLGPLLMAAKRAADDATGRDVLGAALQQLDEIAAEAKRLAAVAEKKA